MFPFQIGRLQEPHGTPKRWRLVSWGYLFSPIDLIPDFIPIIGYLDDLLIVPAGLLLVIRLIPPDVVAEHRETARVAALERKPNWIAAGPIVVTWFLLIVLAVRYIVHQFGWLH